MYINRSIYLSNNFEKIEMKAINEKTRQYFVDLYDRYQMMLNVDMSSYVYKYESLIQWLLNSSHVNQDFKEADYLFFPSWGCVFNTDFSVPELHLKSKYGWTGSLIDIKDCGKLCAYYAIHLLLKLQKRNDIDSCVCCSVENKWPSHKINTLNRYPEMDYVGFLSFTSDANCNSRYIFRYCEIIKNKNSTSWSEKTSIHIANIVDHLNIPRDAYVIYLNHQKINTPLSGVEYVSYPYGSGFLYFSLNSILKNANCNPFEFIFIVDIDDISEACGVALIQKVG